MPITPTPKIWMNGELVDWDDANVHVLTHSLHYGLGVFEGIRAALRHRHGSERLEDIAAFGTLDNLDGKTVITQPTPSARAGGGGDGVRHTGGLFHGFLTARSCR